MSNYSWYYYDYDKLEEYDCVEDAKSIIHLNDFEIAIDDLCLLLANLKWLFSTAQKEHDLDVRFNEGQKTYSKEFDELKKLLDSEDPHHKIDSIKFLGSQLINITSFQLIDDILSSLSKLEKESDVKPKHPKMIKAEIIFVKEFIDDIQRFLQDKSSAKTKEGATGSNKQARIIADIFETIGFQLDGKKSVPQDYIKKLLKRHA